jgi:hypothetical protein
MAAVPGLQGGITMRAVVLVAVVFAVVSAADAQSPYDGSVPLKCAIQSVMSCNSPAGCVSGTAQTVLLPPVITIDVGKRLISGAATGRTAKITFTDQGAGKLMIAGQDLQTLGNMWGVVIEQKTGAMSGAMLSHGGGFLMFGACTGA